MVNGKQNQEEEFEQFYYYEKIQEEEGKNSSKWISESVIQKASWVIAWWKY